ncbi:MAG: hypothetical protein FVQ80_05740 [Planctomycetes bacterium]|nr:hypothetical protein [Planctomycetota bacterium]
MALTGKQKAAMLLMSLDPISACELLKGVEPDTVQDLAVELACLDADSCRNKKEQLKVAQDFCQSLQMQQEFEINTFLKEMLRSTIGQSKTENIQTQIQSILRKHDSIATKDRAVQAKSELALRKVAVILRTLGKELRDSLLGAIKDKDASAAEAVNNLMVLWADITLIDDRPLQEGLENIDAEKLALALTNADQAINEKIRNNISESAAAMIDEEILLMTAPKNEEIKDARNEVVAVLIKMNNKGKLTFIGE